MAQSKSIPFKPGKKKGGSDEPPSDPPGYGDGAPPPDEGWADPEGCPLQAIGHRGGTYYFLTPSGEFRSASDRGLSVNGISSLFDGQTAWLVEHFPLYGKGERVIGFDNQKVAAFLMRQCVRQGLFNSDIPMRGPGVWRGARGDLIVHAGDALLVDGEWEAAGKRIDGVLYPAWPPIERPTLRPAKLTDGLRLLDIANTMWRFATPRGADLAVGWIGAAMLGGAPNWRAHMYLTGEQGSGKTWFSNLVSAAMGAGAHPQSNDATEAGLRQWLTGEARAIILDESEHDEVKGRIYQVIELLRNISSGKGSRSSRGSSNGGKAQLFNVTGCAFLSSVLHAALKPQDRARFTIVKLDQLPPQHDKAKAALVADKTLAAIEEVAALSPGLRARAVARWRFYLDCFSLYRAQFMHVGCSARAADQIATILAGRDLLCADVLPNEDSLEEATIVFRDLVTAAADNDDEGEGQQCLMRLYTSPADLWRSGARETVGEVIEKALDKKTDTEGRWFGKSLRTMGMRLEFDDAGAPWLLVANNHEALNRIFHGSRWAGGVWSQALRFIPGAKAWPKAERFTSPPQRSTAVPQRFLPIADAITRPVKEGETVPSDLDKT